MMIKTHVSIILLFLFIVISCGQENEKKGSLASRIKFKQYYVQGKRLYIKYCSNCHQKDGTGLARLYPPIYQSDYFKSDPQGTICLIRNGLDRQSMVKGTSYNQPMPANPDLTHLEIAELVTYLHSTWGNRDKIIQPAEVSKRLQDCFQSDSH
jgi:mono/diheme cytochrome c family protein